MNQFSFFIRNAGFTAKNPRKAWKTRKAMALFSGENTECNWCGRTKKLHCHHKIPISIRPDLAADPQNFMMLCGKRCHIQVGHGGNYRDYTENIQALCNTVNIIRK